jgi:hypothetical protein
MKALVSSRLCGHVTSAVMASTAGIAMAAAEPARPRPFD